MTGLALFAMLLLFAGPLISQSQALYAALSDRQAMAEHCHDMPATRSSEASAAHNASSSDQDCCDGHWLERCGYCSLLHYSPPLAVAVLSVPQAPATESPFVVAGIAVTHSPIFPGSRSRAPPQCFLSVD